MPQIRVIISNEFTRDNTGVDEVDMTFRCRNKAEAHEFLERAMTAYELPPGRELE